MQRFLNPYRPGPGTRPAVLVGRDRLIDDFAVILRRAIDRRPGKGCMTLGLRGTGKTVLVNRFLEVASDEGVPTAFVEASESGSFRSQMATRLRSALLGLESGHVRRMVTRALGALKSFALHLPNGSSVSVGVEPLLGLADSGELTEDLTDLFVATGEAAVECQTGFVVAVDEAQYLRPPQLGALIAAVHRTTQLDLPVVLVLTGLPQLRGLVGRARSYSERMFTIAELGPLSSEETLDALTIPAEDQGVSFDTSATESIFEHSHGYAYFVQEWGYHTWNAAPMKHITIDDVRAAHEDVLETLDRDFFRVRFDRLTPKEREYLRAMAHLGPGPHRSGDIASHLGIKVQSAAPRRSNLIAKGMIYGPAHGDTAFTVPLFDGFLKRLMPG